MQAVVVWSQMLLDKVPRIRVGPVLSAPVWRAGASAGAGCRISVSEDTADELTAFAIFLLWWSGSADGDTYRPQVPADRLAMDARRLLEAPKRPPHAALRQDLMLCASVQDLAHSRQWP